eukprot:3394480-Pleurochrysis_carterae.AAC.1
MVTNPHSYDSTTSAVLLTCSHMSTTRPNMSVVETCDETLKRSHFGPTVDGLSACRFARQTHREVTSRDLRPNRTCYACLPFYRLFRFVRYRFMFIHDDQAVHVHTDRVP